jgi:hypothetical protein
MGPPCLILGYVFSTGFFPTTWCFILGLTCHVEQDPGELIDLEAPLLIQFSNFLMYLCIIEQLTVTNFN